MEKNLEIVVLPIPRNELTEYKDYIGFLFKNESSVYNVCTTEEDIMKTNLWSKNMPQKAFLVSHEPLRIGDKFLGKASNEKLNNTLFTFVGWTEGGVDLIDIIDEKGEKSISTIHLLDSPKFVRMATPADLKEIVNKQSLNIF